MTGGGNYEICHVPTVAFRVFRHSANVAGGGPFTRPARRLRHCQVTRRAQVVPDVVHKACRHVVWPVLRRVAVAGQQVCPRKVHVHALAQYLCRRDGGVGFAGEAAGQKVQRVFVGVAALEARGHFCYVARGGAAHGPDDGGRGHGGSRVC